MASNTVLAKLAVVISANAAEFNKTLNTTNRNFEKFTGGVKNLIGGLGLAIGAKEALSFGFEMSKLAGEVQGVKAAFDKLGDSNKLMVDLKDATANTVSELELMKRSVQAANFGISLEALPKLLEFATLRAQQTGQSVDYLVDSIVTGIGRKSPLILDNLGISAVALKDKLGDVSIAAADVGTVAEAVGKIASDELKKMGDFSENTSSKVQQLNATWENLKATLGKKIQTSGLIDFSNNFLNFLALLAGGGEATMEALEGGIRALNYGRLEGEQFEKALKGVKEIAEQLGVKLVKLRDERTGFAKYVIDTRTAIKQGKETVNVLSEEEIERRKVAKATAEELAMKTKLADINRRLTGRADPATNALGSTIDVAPALERAKMQMKQFTDAFRSFKAESDMLVLDLSGSISGAISDIAMSLGEAFSGGEDFGKSFLKILSNFCAQVGSAAIALGITMLNLKAAFASPGAAIAAGVALLAVAGALGAASKAQDSFNRGSARSAGSGSSRTSAGSLFDQLGQRIYLEGQFEVSGTSLKTVITNQNRVDLRTKA